MVNVAPCALTAIPSGVVSTIVPKALRASEADDALERRRQVAGLLRGNMRKPASDEQRHESNRRQRSWESKQAAAANFFDTSRSRYPDSDVPQHFAF